ncbi:MAG: large subunit ribosomal protein L21e [Patescibacteria group bacterium]|jgi:large subunit ribosomal protein L21e
MEFFLRSQDMRNQVRVDYSEIVLVYIYNMVKGKKIREKGKIRFSDYFKSINDGDRVAVVEEKSVVHAFPCRIQGKSGVVEGTRGSCKIVKLNDGKKEKTFLIHPVHLKKI